MPLFSSRRKPLSSSRRKDTPSPVRSVSPPNRSRGPLSRSSRPTARAEDRSGSSLSESSARHSRPHDSYDSGGSHRNETDTGRRSRGLFGRRRARSFDRHDLAHDQTLLNARARVADAEAAERGADAALNAARSAIREARDHVKMLEREAVDEGKRAKRKQAEARNVRKTARHLGRHG
ncbi:hypothetical protein BC826DRAFT_985671 [Russula brevipes]|nr:hypothetical protein BC826DRAFT_985671 [Russula brevipes]